MTHRRRSSRAGELPPRLKILSVGRAGARSRARGRSLRAFVGLSFTQVVASLGLPATAGRHSTATATPALPRYHYPHFVQGLSRWEPDARVPCRMFGEKQHGWESPVRQPEAKRSEATWRDAGWNGSTRVAAFTDCMRAAGRPCRPC